MPTFTNAHILLLTRCCKGQEECGSSSTHAQALTEAKANDLMFWASRYSLFIHWSANRSHPWDKLPSSEAACCTLEIGKLRDSDNEVHKNLCALCALYILCAYMKSVSLLYMCKIFARRFI